jgi:MFS family permease
MISELMRDFAATAVVLGNLSAFYYYAYASIQLPVGVLLDRFGPRRVLSAALLLSGLGSLVLATAQALPQAYLGRLLVSSGVGFALVGTLKVAAVWFPPRRFALITGLTFILGMVGAPRRLWLSSSTRWAGATL